MPLLSESSRSSQVEISYSCEDGFSRVKGEGETGMLTVKLPVLRAKDNLVGQQGVELTRPRALRFSKSAHALV